MRPQYPYVSAPRATTPPLHLGTATAAPDSTHNRPNGSTTSYPFAAPQLRGTSQPIVAPAAATHPQPHQMYPGTNATRAMNNAPDTVPLRVPQVENFFVSQPSSPVKHQQQHQQQQQRQDGPSLMYENHHRHQQQSTSRTGASQSRPPAPSVYPINDWQHQQQQPQPYHNGEVPAAQYHQEQQQQHYAAPSMSHQMQGPEAGALQMHSNTGRATSTVAAPAGKYSMQRTSSVAPPHQYDSSSQPQQQTQHPALYHQPASSVPRQTMTHPSASVAPSHHQMNAPDQSAATVTNNAMMRYHQRQQQDLDRQRQLDLEEAQLAAEEATLNSQLAQLKAEGESMMVARMTINAGWEQIYEDQEWFNNTPDEDLSREIAAVQYRCQALEQHLEELKMTLRGHEIELKRYDSNETLRQQQLTLMKTLEECVRRMETRRKSVRSVAERHFDVEAQRERACNFHMANITTRLQTIGYKPPTIHSQNNNKASANTTRVAPQQQSKPNSRAGSVAPLQPLQNLAPNSVVPFAQQQQRQKVVSFRSTSNNSQRPATREPSLAPPPQTSFAYQPNGALDGPSFTVGLDDESAYFGSVRDDSISSMYGEYDLSGLNGNSLAISVCDTKRHRADAITAM